MLVRKATSYVYNFETRMKQFAKPHLFLMVATKLQIFGNKKSIQNKLFFTKLSHSVIVMDFLMFYGGRTWIMDMRQ